MIGILKKGIVQTDNKALKEALKSEAFLVDVRTPEEYASGTVKGAVNIPLDNIAGHLLLFEGKSNIIVFCRTGNRSGQAKNILNKNGFQQVINGGRWQDVKQALYEIQ